VQNFIEMRRPFYLFLLLFLGCESGGGPVTPTVIMPLAVGNRWIGQITETDSAGNVVSVSLDTQTVYRTEIVNGETWYYRNLMPLVLMPRNGKPDSLSFDTVDYIFTNRTDGLYQAYSSQFTLRPIAPWLIAKYPASVGDTMRIDTLDMDTPPQTRVINIVAGTQTKVTVPAGMFTCYKYQEILVHRQNGITTSRLVDSSFYAPDIGLVQYIYELPDFDNPSASHHVLWQLVRAELH
jgi:hypothetical protein